MEFIPHSEKQERAIFSQARITLCGAGIQWGKSRVGAVRSKWRMHTYTSKDDAFIIAAPTYKIMQQSTLPAFKNINRDIWDKNYSAQYAEFRMPGGGTCYFRTGTDPDSVVGITNVRGIWGDEAGKFSLLFWQNLQARASFRRCQIDLTTSPYTLNWIYRELIRPKLRDPAARPDCLFVQAASNENPYFPQEEFDEKRLTMDTRRFKMIYGGQWERPAGLVYDCFDEELNQCDPFELPAGTKFYGGIDWGYTEPFVFKIRAITPAGQHYGVSEFYKTNLIVDQQCDEVVRRCSVWPVSVIYAGPDRPENIAKMNAALKKAGLKTAVVGARNEKRLGLDIHYELLKSRRLKYWRGMNPHTIDEIDSYHYPEPEDLDPDDKAKEALPVEQHDHAVDADRYLSIMTFQTHEKRSPAVPSDKPKRETPHELVERLKRKRRTTHGEEWSA